MKKSSKKNQSVRMEKLTNGEQSHPDRSAVEGGEARQPLPTPERRMVPYALVRPDPDQPRKTFSEASLDEMALSIIAQLESTGQPFIQDPVLEFVPAKFRILEPELHDKMYRVEEMMPDGLWMRAFGDEDEAKCRSFAGETNLQDYYRIVCGERRWRGGGAREIKTATGVMKWHGLTEFPAKVFTGLSAKQRADMQLIENYQRENVSALEEAAALKRQLEERRVADPKFSPEDLGKAIGMPRSQVYARLALTRLSPSINEAVLAGKISVSIAAAIAMLPTPKMQAALLKTVLEEMEYNAALSSRDVDEIIDTDFIKQLSEAPFDKKSVPLDPGVICASCVECPYRTGNMLDEFPELKSKQQVCTQPDCFAAKCKAHWAAEAERIAGKGGLVLTEKEFKKVKSDYVDATREGYGLFEEWTSPKKALGKHAPETVLVSTADGLKEYYKLSDIPAAAKKAKVKLDSEKTESKEEREAREAERKAQEEKRTRWRVFVVEQFQALVKGLEKIKDAVGWEIGALLAEGVNSYGYGNREKWDLVCKTSKHPRARALGVMFMHEGNRVGVDRDGEDDVLKAWKLAGIDLVKGFAEAEKAEQLEMALPAGKAEAKQGTLIEVKKNKKKGGRGKG